MIAAVIAQQGLDLGGTLWIFALLFLGAAVVATWVALKAGGPAGVLKLWFAWPAIAIWKVLLNPLRVHGSRIAIDLGKSALRGGGKTKVSDPTSAELVTRRRVDPARPRGIEALGNGNHSTVGGVVGAVHKVIVGQAGSGKNQTDLNYELQHQLEYSAEHLIVIDPKKNAPLTKIVQAYARPGIDRVFSYSFHPADHDSSSLRLFKDPDEAADLAYMLCDEPGEKDSHWNGKAGDLIAAVAQALSWLSQEAELATAEFAGEQRRMEFQDLAEITVTLNEIRDVIVDREKLNQLIDISPLVSNVADESKEWGYIRSTASRRLSALSSMVVRRVFAGGAGTPQPDFARTDGRDIVIIRPHARSAKRLARYIYAVLDANYRHASDGGDAGGPGCKVLVDEAGSYMKLQNLPEYIDLGRESKVRMTYVLQGVRQLKSKLGTEEAMHTITATEVKVIGATSDSETAEMMSRLSGKSRVHHRKPRQDSEILGQWDDEERPLVAEQEITRQVEGQWTLQHGPRIWKVEVPENRYHYAQAAEPRPDHPLWGHVDPDTYKVPPILAPKDEDEGGDPQDTEDDGRDRSGSRRDRELDDDAPNDGPEEGDDDEWF